MDHTEFLNYKTEMDKWLAIANDTVEDCSGTGTELETKQRLNTINVSQWWRWWV